VVDRPLFAVPSRRRSPLTYLESAAHTPLACTSGGHFREWGTMKRFSALLIFLGLLASSVLINPPAAHADAPTGAWTQAEHMRQSRRYHAAVRLANGKVHVPGPVASDGLDGACGGPGGHRRIPRDPVHVKEEAADGGSIGPAATPHRPRPPTVDHLAGQLRALRQEMALSQEGIVTQYFPPGIERSRSGIATANGGPGEPSSDVDNRGGRASQLVLNAERVAGRRLGLTGAEVVAGLAATSRSTPMFSAARATERTARSEGLTLRWAGLWRTRKSLL
jgi:hypothetical protein